MNIDKILNKYYNNATYKYCPDFDYNDEEIQAELLPEDYDQYAVWNIFEARPEWENILVENGYDIVYHILDWYDNSKEFIGCVIDDKLYDITDELSALLGEEEEEIWDEDEMITYGKELYNAYGPDVEVNDMNEYDAECYLAYKRSIN